MTSSPLFIRSPIDGNLRAHAQSVRHWAGVASRIAARLRSRKGPPLHVRVIFSIPRPGRNQSIARSRCARCRPVEGVAVRRHLAHEEAPGADQHLIVGKGYDATLANRRQRRFEPGGADDPRHDPIGRPLGRLDQSRPAACHRDPRAGKRLPQRRVIGRVGHRGKPRAERTRLLGQEGGVVVGGQCLDGEGVAVAHQEVDRAPSDRPGRAEDRHPARPVGDLS